MIGTLIGIIFALIILGVMWWAIQQLMGLIPIAEPFKTIIYVLCVVLLIWVLGILGIHFPPMVIQILYAIAVLICLLFLVRFLRPYWGTWWGP